METLVAAICVWATCNVIGFWIVRTVLMERQYSEPGAAPLTDRSPVVRQLDVTILVCGGLLAAALVAYIALGVRG